MEENLNEVFFQILCGKSGITQTKSPRIRGFLL